MQSHRPVWLLPAALAGALLLFGASGCTDAEEPARHALAEPAVQDLGRCAYCGWIESKREVLPDIYEYTARMADGTSRVFREPLPTSWRLGERLLVIDGAGAGSTTDQGK